MKKPTNIALDADLQRRLRIAAAARGVRPCVLVAQALEESLIDWELQMMADTNRRREPAAQRAKGKQ